MNPSTLSEDGRKSALRLVSTKGMSREEWLEIRQSGIGSSDAAAAVGLNPYQSQLELWMHKTGRGHLLPQVDPNDESSPMYWGSLLEPIVAMHYTKHTGNRVRRVNAVLQHPDEDKSWMLANLDYSVIGAEDVQILECKTAGEFGSRLWRDGVPEYIQCQVQHQLAVTGKQAADVCVLLCGQEIRTYRIGRDDVLIARLVELERHFWQYVETDTQPPVDGSDSAGAALRYLFPSDAGTVLDLTNNPTMSAQFDELVSLRETLQQLNAQEELIKQQIQQAMGEATKAVFANGHITWKRSKDAVYLDTERLIKDQPGLVERYQQVRPGSRRFIIKS